MKIIITFFYVVLLFFLNNFSFAKHIFIEKYDDKEFCSPVQNNNISNLDEKFPDKFRIEIADSGGWYRNIFKAVKSSGNSKYNLLIDKSVKSYFSGKLIAEYKNGQECSFEADIKIHGGHSDHLSQSEFISSMRVRLKEGNILKRKYFTLFLPEARNNENEVFISTLLNKLNFLSPLTFKTRVKVNLNEQYSDFIFQERFDWHFLRENNKRPGPILSGNKSFQIHEKGKINENIILSLMRVEKQVISNKKEILNALDLANFYYLKNLTNESFPITEKYEENNFIDDFIAQNFLYFEKKLTDISSEKIEKIATFDALLIASGGIHSLELNDRKFYYDLVSDKLEPIYYDGMVKILNEEYNPQIKFVYDHYKYGALKAKQKIQQLEVDELIDDLKIRGLRVDKDVILKTIKNIQINLDKIISAENYKFNLSDKKNNFFNEDQFEIKFDLAFGGEKNIYKVCKSDLSECNDIRLTDSQSFELLKEQIIEINNKSILYVRKDYEKYIKSLSPDSYGISSMKNVLIDKDLEISITDSINLSIDKINKKIDIEFHSPNDRAVINNQIVKNWNFNLIGKKQLDDTIKKNISDPEGCLTFVDTSLENISVKSENNSCHASIQFIRSRGTLNSIEIINAKEEAFDADFSNLTIDKIYIDGSGDECIGIKKGNYIFRLVNLNNCNDKAFSAGAWSKATLDKVIIKNSKFGLVSKRSSVLSAYNVKISETHRCLVAYAEEFGGSKIVTNKEQYNCSNNSSYVDNKSIWEKI